jgi:hypothetical protein
MESLLAGDFPSLSNSFRLFYSALDFLLLQKRECCPSLHPTSANSSRIKDRDG